MRASLEALLAGCIDYAGAFPPAELPVSQALHHYEQYREGPHAALLGRFVCPAARLAELPPLAAETRCSIVLRAAAERAQLMPCLATDLTSLCGLRVRQGPRARVESVELALPADADATQPACLRELGSRVAESGIGPVLLFCEVRADAAMRLIDSLAAIAHSQSVPLRWGFKLRMVGPRSPAAAPAQVARVIVACRDAALPWKATAGLHEPLSRWDRAASSWRAGFVNLLAAAVLAGAHRLDTEAVESILIEPSAAAFRFDDAALYWRELGVDRGGIAAARRSGLASFGSCSFDEPCHALQSLGWM